MIVFGFPSHWLKHLQGFSAYHQAYQSQSCNNNYCFHSKTYIMHKVKGFNVVISLEY